MPPVTIDGDVALPGAFVGPVDGVPRELDGVRVGAVVRAFGVRVDGAVVPAGWPTGSATGASPGPARLATSVVVPTSVNGSLTMLAAAKPTLTEATAKTAQRATSVTLLGTANLPDLLEPVPLSLRYGRLTAG